MAYDSRGPNPFLELDEINARWRDLALEFRDAGGDGDRKRLQSLMDWEMHVYAEKLAALERIVNEYRLKIRRENARRLDPEKRRKLEHSLERAQDALGRSVIVQDGRKLYGGLYDLGNSVWDLIERLRHALKP